MFFLAQGLHVLIFVFPSFMLGRSDSYSEGVKKMFGRSNAKQLPERREVHGQN